MKGKRFTRVLSLMLAATMLFGMAPTALAGGGGDNDTQEPNYDSGDGKLSIPGYADYYGSFTRFTLVKFHFSDRQSGSIAASDWSDYEVVGTVDVIGRQDYTTKTIDPNGVANGVAASYKTNALGYRYSTDIASYMNDNKQSSWSPIMGDDWLPDFVYGNNTSMKDAILDMFGEYSRPVGSRNFYSMEEGTTKRIRFDNLLLNMDQDPDSRVTSAEFLQEHANYCYRLLAEPGVVCEIAGSKTAMTLRDMMGWSKYIKGEYWVSGNATTWPLWYQWYHRTRNMAFGMYLGSCELTTYDWSNEGEIQEEKLNVHELADHDTTSVVFQAVLDAYRAGESTTNYNQYGWYREHVFGQTDNGISGTDTVYSAGDYVGYGLGIIAPYNYASSMVRSNLTISKNVVGNLASTTDKTSRYFGFEIKLNVPDGVTVTGYETYASGYGGTVPELRLRDNTDSDSDKYNKVVKFEIANSDGSGTHDENLGLLDNMNISLIFDNLQEGQTVAYSVQELSANQDGYVTLINSATTEDGKIESDVVTLNSLSFVNAKQGARFTKVVGVKDDGSKAYPDGTEFQFNIYGTYTTSDGTRSDIDFPVYYTKYDASGNEIEGSSGTWDNLCQAGRPSGPTP